jgi:hypothetical protein
MGKTGTIIATGLAIAVVATALFSPGRQTTQGIQSIGGAGQNLFLGAEGQ